MREQFNLDRLIEYGTEPVPDTVKVVNPEYRKLDSEIKSRTTRLSRLTAKFGSLEGKS